MRLSLVSALWMLLVLATSLALDSDRALLSQEAASSIKSGDLELETSRVYVRVGTVGVTDRLLIYGDLIVAP